MGTDMAKHATDLSAMTSKLATLQIRDGENMEKLVGGGASGKELFENQQQILEFALHSSDLSTVTRSFEVVHEWTYLLFTEFFKQGDKEKAESLPITFLCDRETTNVAKS